LNFGLFFLLFVGVSLWLYRVNPSLAQERMRLGGSNQQGWDRVLFPIMFYFSFGMAGSEFPEFRSFSLVTCSDMG